MAKDPAVLFYISDWLTSTAEMDADCRGWYLNLLLHNYDKGSLPGDTESLAVLAGVKYSEYSRFEQVLKQVLKQKFEQTDEGRISNRRTCSILKGREQFKEKRQRSGTIGYITKMFNKLGLGDIYEIELVKAYFYELSIEEIEELKDEQVLKQVLKQKFKLYRNENENENRNIIKDKGGVGEKEKVPAAVKVESNEKLLDLRSLVFRQQCAEHIPVYGEKMITAFASYWTEPNKSKTKMRFEMEKTWEMKRRLATWASNEDKFKGGKQKMEAAAIISQKEYTEF